MNINLFFKVCNLILTSRLVKIKFKDLNVNKVFEMCPKRETVFLTLEPATRLTYLLRMQTNGGF